jgi:hypothetical protein
MLLWYFLIPAFVGLPIGIWGKVKGKKPAIVAALCLTILSLLMIAGWPVYVMFGSGD